jgi:glycosyltransferase involved in cell wall biosynthesis
MKSIAIITSHAESLKNFRGPLIDLLVNKGIKVYALAPDHDIVSQNQMRLLGAVPVSYTLFRAGMNPLQDSIDLLRLVLLLRKLKPTITLAYSIKPVIYATLAAYLAGIKRRYASIEGLGFVFTHSDAHFEIKRHFLRILVEKLYKFSLIYATKVIFLNKDDRNLFISKKILPGYKSMLLGGIGVDLDVWTFQSPVVQPITFLLMARLLREKGICEYAEAARIVKKLYPSAKFLLLGSLDVNPGGLSRAEILSWVDEGLLDWLGHIPVQEWIAKSSIYVLPSYREGVPRSTQEAMAMGRPIITTDVPGCRETVIEGFNGFLVPARDSQSLAKIMIYFIENPKLIKTMGIASRELAEKLFDVHKINSTLLDAINIDSVNHD